MSDLVEGLADLFGVGVDEVEIDGGTLTVEQHDSDGPSVSVDHDGVRLEWGCVTLEVDVVDADPLDTVRRCLAAVKAWESWKPEALRD